MIMPSSLRGAVRDSSVAVGVTAPARARNFVVPFQKRLILRANPAAALFIRVLAGTRRSSLVEFGVGIGVQRAMGASYPLLDGLKSVTVEYPYLLHALRAAMPTGDFEPLSKATLQQFAVGAHVVHVSGLLERLPAPEDFLFEIANAMSATSAIVVSLRPEVDPGQVLPDDCYQQWTDAEFSDLVRKFGLSVAAVARTKYWRTFLLARTNAASKPGVAILKASNLVYRMLPIDKTAAARRADRMILTILERSYKLSIDSAGVTTVDVSSAASLDGSQDAIEITNLESLDHLEKMRDEARRRYPREAIRASNREILAKIQDAVQTRTPLSVVRVSHAEIRALSYPAYYPPVWLNRSLRVCFGSDIDVGSYGTFLRDLDDAVRSADVIGVPDPWSKDLQHATNALLLARQGIGDDNEKFFGDLHFALFNGGLLDKLVNASRKTTIITSRDLLERFRIRFPETDVRHVKIPGEARWMDLKGRTHVPDVYDDIVATVRAREKGELFLIGAGLAAKKYCQIARDSGGIALDIGSVFDLWAGAATRTGFEDRIEQARL